jgi:hypothetical protein
MDPNMDTNSPNEPKRKISVPKTLDPGWATVLAGIIALLGTIAILIFSRINEQGTNPGITEVVAKELHTETPTLEITVEPSSTQEPEPTAILSPTLVLNEPVVQILSGLTTVQQQALQATVDGLLGLAQLLPLVVRDGFDTNDYAWPEFRETYEKGVQCDVAINEGKYNILVVSTETSGGAWCMTSNHKISSDFYLSVDTQLTQNRNTDILLNYRYQDENNYYFLILNQQTQKLTIGILENGEVSYLVQSVFFSSINKSDMNNLKLLALGGSHALFINEALALLISNEDRFKSGFIAVGVRLNEADQDEGLVIDNYELRGN